MTTRNSPDNTRWTAALTAALALSLASAPLASAADPDIVNAAAAASEPPATVAYFTAVPCPTVVRPVALRSVHRHVRRRRAHVHHVAAVHPVTPKLHRIATHHRRVHHHPHRIAAAASTAPARCEVLHRDNLLRASVDRAFGLGGDSAPAEIAPVEGGGGPTSFTTLPGAGVPGGGGSLPGGGGGGGVGGGGGGALPSDYVAPSLPTNTSAAPEPGTWLLLSLGVGLMGSALRQARRHAATRRKAIS